MVDLDTKLKIKVSSELVSVAIAKDILLSNVFEIADREVDGTPSCESTVPLDGDNVRTNGRSAHHTLFRSNTVLTKTIESLMAWYGKAFLEASVGTTIRRLCLENVSIEVDPLRNAKGPKDVERNIDLLVYWCREIWEQIYSVRQQCPKYVSFIRRCMLPYNEPVRCANCSSIFACWWRGVILPWGTAQAQIANCHGKAFQRSVFFGSLCQLSSIHISSASALVCCAVLGVYASLITKFQVSRISPFNEVSL
jgi:hypothetical protein